MRHDISGVIIIVPSIKLEPVVKKIPSILTSTALKSIQQLLFYTT